MSDSKKNSIPSREELEQHVRVRASKDSAFREVLKANPRTALEQNYQDWFADGKVPAGKTIKVIEEDQNTLYLVLPPFSNFPDEIGEDLLEKVQGGAVNGAAIKGLGALKGKLQARGSADDTSGFNCPSQYCGVTNGCSPDQTSDTGYGGGMCRR